MATKAIPAGPKIVVDRVCQKRVRDVDDLKQRLVMHGKYALLIHPLRKTAPNFVANWV